MMMIVANNDNFVTSFVPPPLLSFPLTQASSSSPLKFGVLSHLRSRRLTISNEDNDEDVVNVDDASSAFNRAARIESTHHQTKPNRRRTLLRRSSSLLAAASTIIIAISSPSTAATATTTFKSTSVNAAGLGTLPEFANTNAILQSITIDCDNMHQYMDTLNFFIYSFDMKILRQRNTTTTSATSTTTTTKKKQNMGEEDLGNNNTNYMKEAWLGYGPEELSIPANFIFPISSFANYGGHSSLHIRYIPSSLYSSDSDSATSSSSSSLLYPRTPNSEYNNEPAPGNNIAYIQLGVPTYRISQMVKYGGNVIDAYGYVNVICPAGVPIRAIVGTKTIDPIMFIAINCINVTKSTEFYTTSSNNDQLLLPLGGGGGGLPTFTMSDEYYPYARPNQGQGQFEPPQPKGSVYILPTCCSSNSPISSSSSSCANNYYGGMGILLLPKEEKKTKSIFGIAYGNTLSFTDNNVDLIPNPVVKSLNIVYNAPTTRSNEEEKEDNSNSSSSSISSITDPSFIPISFISQNVFTHEIKTTIKNSN